MNNLLLVLGFFLMSNFSEKKEISVYVFIAEECPICNYMGKPLSQVAEQYGDFVNLYVVFPLKNSNYKKINNFKTKYNLQKFESILDKDQSLTKLLGATITPEVVVTEKGGRILYRGRVNDAYFAPGKVRHGARNNDLMQILKRALSGLSISKPWNSAVGCYITFYK